MLLLEKLFFCREVTVRSSLTTAPSPRLSTSSLCELVPTLLILSILLMSLIILHGSRLPVVRVMRIAGQYAKPRSKPTEKVEMEVTEVIDGEEYTRIKQVEVLSFRGDNVNGYETTERKADPDRLLG